MIYDHVSGSLSELDTKMVRAIPEGGNWRNLLTASTRLVFARYDRVLPGAKEAAARITAGYGGIVLATLFPLTSTVQGTAALYILWLTGSSPYARPHDSRASPTHIASMAKDAPAASRSETPFPPCLHTILVGCFLVEQL